MAKAVGINLAIGPSCFVRCRGCYNFFGNTHRRGGLISATEIIDFVTAARLIGVTKLTLSGGDPLTHPEILTIIRETADLGLIVKLDTVGTAFLGAARKIFYGQGEVQRVSVGDVAPYVSVVGLPLDGAQDATIREFRRGRPGLVNETRLAARLLIRAGVRLCINTVAHRLNVGEVTTMQALVAEMGAHEWQIFEFQPIGPLGSHSANALELPEGEFENLARLIALESSGSVHPKIECKSRRDREKLYFMVDDTGLAWTPASIGPVRTTIGHITHERQTVLTHLARHVQQASNDHPRM
jgi:MoaA/NifB/PqqE/SkfB family radical SAM enzyme